MRRRDRGSEAQESSGRVRTRLPARARLTKTGITGIKRAVSTDVFQIQLERSEQKLGSGCSRGAQGPLRRRSPGRLSRVSYWKENICWKERIKQGRKRLPHVTPVDATLLRPLVHLNPLTGRHTDGCRQKVNKNEERRGMLCFRSIRSCSQVGGGCLPVAARRWSDFPHSLSHTEP